MQKKPKNLIIISIDTLRSDCVAASSNKDIYKEFNLSTKLQTPILDWYMKNGTSFSNCVSAAPYTTTSHASILTGQLPNTHKLKHFCRNKLVSETIFEILKKKGYATLSQVDFPFLGPILGFANGVDKFVECNDGESFEWIKKNKMKPLVCFFHLAGAHSPFGFAMNTKEKDGGLGRFVKKIYGLKLKYNFKVKNDEITKNRREFYSITAQEEMLWNVYSKIIITMHSEKRYDEVMDLYVEGVNAFEKNRLSNFLKRLKKTGVMDDAIVIFVGDHGESWSENQRGHHDRAPFGEKFLYNGVIKVPLIFFGAGIPAGLEVDKQIRTIDIVPTVLQLLELKNSGKKFDGKSLLPFDKNMKNQDAYAQSWTRKNGRRIGFNSFEKEVEKNKGYLNWSAANYMEQDSLSDGKLKIIRHFDFDGNITKTEYMDISSHEKAVVPNESYAKKLLEKIEIFAKSRQENGNDALDEREINLIEKQMKSLGY